MSFGVICWWVCKGLLRPSLSPLMVRRRHFYFVVKFPVGRERRVEVDLERSRRRGDQPPLTRALQLPTRGDRDDAGRLHVVVRHRPRSTRAVAVSLPAARSAAIEMV